MRQLGYVLIVIVMVALCYVTMLVYMPVINTMVQTANATITASGANLTAMPGSTSFLISTPWLMWFAPAVIGMIAVCIILREQIWG